MILKIRRKFGKLKQIGPGVIAGSSGNDAGGIATYTIAGASIGYRLQWCMLIATPMLMAIHEMCSRAAFVTKKGLGSLIRECFGAKIALLLTIVMFITNVAVITANIAGMSVAIELLTNIDARIFVIPLVVLIWFMITRGTYKKVEKILLILSLGLFAYVITAFIVKPNLVNILTNTFIPNLEFNPKFLMLVVGVLGATVSPYIYYFYTSAELEKSRMNITEARSDAIIGAFWCGLIGFFILLVGAAVLYTSGIHDIQTAKDAALALKPLAGEFAFILFAIGLFAASMLAASVLSLTSAYTTCETFGLESGIEKRIHDAPTFYLTFSMALGIGSLIMLLGFDPITIMFLSMVICGIVTPIMIFLLMKICNNRDYMGNYVNGKISNIIGWFTFIVISILVIAMFGSIIWH